MPTHDVGTWDRRFHWGTLRTLGNSRLVTSSILWLLVVPIAAKLLAPFAGEHTFNLPCVNEPIAVMVALPFSWQRFYLMSWLFVLGQAVYFLACPEIVRKYASYGDYRRDHTASLQLRVFLRRALLRPTEAARERILTMTGAGSVEPANPQAAVEAVELVLEHAGLHGREEPAIRQNRVFDAVLEVERHALHLWIWVSGLFFAGGLALFAWVVVEGVVEVVKLL